MSDWDVVVASTKFTKALTKELDIWGYQLIPVTLEDTVGKFYQRFYIYIPIADRLTHFSFIDSEIIRYPHLLVQTRLYYYNGRIYCNADNIFTYYEPYTKDLIKDGNIPDLGWFLSNMERSNYPGYLCYSDSTTQKRCAEENTFDINILTNIISEHVNNIFSSIYNTDYIEYLYSSQLFQELANALGIDSSIFEYREEWCDECDMFHSESDYDHLVSGFKDFIQRLSQHPEVMDQVLNSLRPPVVEKPPVVKKKTKSKILQHNL